MREILFRGKRLDNDEWVEGLVAQLLYTKNGIVQSYYFTEIQNGIESSRTVLASTVGQYTGLTDKNGTKIFEGDIVKHHFGNEYGVVKFGEYSQPFNDDKFTKHIGFYVDWITGKCKHILRKDLGFWANIKEYDIFTGNIHDNPELLGVSDNG